MLERARRDEHHITQELIANDLGSTSRTLRRLVSGSGWTLKCAERAIW